MSLKQQQRSFSIPETREIIMRDPRTRELTQQQKQQQKQVKKRRILSSSQRQSLSQKQKKLGDLIYSQALVDAINTNCLQSNEQIVLYDANQSKNMYVKKSDSGGEDYYIVMTVNNKPVSQIQYSFDENNYTEMTISSDTEKSHRKRHYNTILRVATILLAPTMKMYNEPIEKIYSRAQNPLSVYSLFKLGFNYENYILENQELDTSWYTPSIQQQQTQQQKKQRIQEQKELLQYLTQLKQGDDNFEIYMVLRKKNFKTAVKLAKITLQRLLGCQL